MRKSILYLTRAVLILEIAAYAEGDDPAIPPSTFPLLVAFDAISSSRHGYNVPRSLPCSSDQPSR